MMKFLLREKEKLPSFHFSIGGPNYVFNYGTYDSKVKARSRLFNYMSIVISEENWERNR